MAPQNRLLGSLAEKDQKRLLKQLEAVELPFRCVLYGANRPIEFVHFLETGVGSLVSRMRNGDASEVGTIGNEGIVGLPVVFGDNRAPTNVICRCPAQACACARRCSRTYWRRIRP